ncbi:MAG: PAS domain S-box protein, partial [Syntrophobacterales bacterium]
MTVMDEWFYYYLRKLSRGFFALPFPYCNGIHLRVFPLIILFLFLAVAGAKAAGEIDTIQFTEVEKNWLVAHPVISIAPDPYFPPIEYFDEDGEYRGVAADYIALMEKRLGIRFVVRRYESWNEVLEKVRKREVDALPAAAQTPERSGYVLFSDPHITLPGVIITRKEVEADLTMESLKGMKVSVVKSYAWHEFIRNDYPDIGLDLVPDLETGLKKVSLGVSDALIATLPVAIYYIEKEGITNLRVAGETGYFTRLSFATRSDWPEFHGIMEKTLAQLTDKEKKAIREKWVHLDKDSIVSGKFWTSVIAGLGVITLVFMGILLWTRTLRKRINERTHELNRELAEHRKTEVSLRESEKKYRDLVENMKDIFYVADETGRISYMSPAAESITGYETSEIIGRYIPEFLHSEDIPVIAEQFQKIISGITEPTEYRLITKQGNVIWVLTATQPVYDKDRVVGVQGIITDITDLKRTEEKLRKSEEKYRTIIESIQESYFEADLSGRLTFFNNFLCSSLGYSRDELEGMDFRQYTAPESAENLYKTLHDVYLTGNTSEIVDYKIITKDGRIGYAELSASLIVDSDGTPVGFRGVARDVTERKRAEREIRERGAYLEEVLRVAPDAVLTLDNDSRIVEWNEGAERLFGYSLDEAVGQNIDELLTDSDTLEEADNLSRQVLNGKKVPPVEVVRYGKDGTPLNVIVAGSPIMMGGEMIGAVAIYTNITDRKRMEALWRRYEFIVNTSGDIMTLIDRDYVYEVANDAFSRGLNLAGQEIA